MDDAPAASLGLKRSQLRPGHPDFLDLPWGLSLDAWDGVCPRLEELAAGLSRHTVRFVNYGGALYALKELGPGEAAKEYALLRDMAERRVPAVTAVGHVDARCVDVQGAQRDTSVLVTRYLDHSLPYHSLFLHSDLQRYRAHLVDALASLLVQLHLSGVYWGDCSLFNTLFLRDAGALQAFLVDAETAVLYERIEDVTREQDLFILEENIVGALCDLQAMTQRPTPSAEALCQDLRRRYRELWALASQTELFKKDERYRIDERVRQLNRAGFSVGELSIEPVDGAELLRLRVLVTDRTFHKDLLHSLTGLDVLEAQAQQMMNEIHQWRASLSTQRARSVSVSAAAHAWLRERFEPAVAKLLSAGLRDDPAELYCRLLEHKWLMSEAARHDVGHESALEDLLTRAAPSL
jgi:hypothetical protein